MYCAEIDENKKCFHVTPDKLPPSDTIIETEYNNVLGKIWNGTDWEEDLSFEEPEEPTYEPTQLDRIESALSILTADTVRVESIDTAISEGVNEV